MEPPQRPPPFPQDQAARDSPRISCCVPVTQPLGLTPSTSTDGLSGHFSAFGVCVSTAAP